MPTNDFQLPSNAPQSPIQASERRKGHQPILHPPNVLIPRQTYDYFQIPNTAEVVDAMCPDILTCEWETFWDHYLPATKPSINEIGTCVDALTLAQKLTPLVNGWVPHRWSNFTLPTSFPVIIPSFEFEHENEGSSIFQPLEGIVEEIARAISGTRRQGTGSFPPGSSSLRLNVSRNDSLRGINGYFHFEAQGVVSSDVALCIQARKLGSVKDQIENRRKLLRAATEIMNNDPHRDFMYALVIEGQCCVVWYFSRSHSVMSLGFDWFANYSTFISLLATFIFAEPRHLGFNISIIPHISFNDQDSFIYEVADEYYIQPRYFKTLRPILDQCSSPCISGKSTRVWEVQEVLSLHDPQPLTGQTMVLKDSWIDAYENTERQIQEEIFRDLEDFQARLFSGCGNFEPAEFTDMDQAHKEQLRHLLQTGRYRDHFLTIVADCTGPVTLAAPSSARRSAKLLQSGAIWHAGKQCSEVDIPIEGNMPRRRCIVVYDEVCKAVHDLDRFSDVAVALYGGVVALSLLFIAGWVHRDVSSGNIMLYEPPDGSFARGILADFEFAERFSLRSSRATHSVQHGHEHVPTIMGTPCFLPHHVHYSPSLTSAGLSSHDNSTSDPITLSREIQHSPVHDIESLWWLFLWTVTVRLPPSTARTPEFQHNRKILRRIFPSNIHTRSAERYEVFMSEQYFYSLLRGMLHESINHWVSTPLDLLRSGLIEVYDNCGDMDGFGWKDEDEEEMGSRTRRWKKQVNGIYSLAFNLVEIARVAAKEESSIPYLLPVT